MLSVVQVSDIHLGTGERNEERARRLFQRIAGLSRSVDAVLVTGDIADQGTPQQYAVARELFASVPFPVFSCPGNHDERAAYAKALLGRTQVAGPVNEVAEAGGAVFALCDSTVPGEPGGRLADETLDWLDRVLAHAPAGAPVFVCFHHPPVEVHVPVLDAMRQTGGERLAALLRRHDNVTALLCGHVHTPAATTFAGLPLLICPSVVSTVLLPWEGGDAVDEQAPAALAFHVLDDAGRLTTHFRVVP